MEPPKSPKDVLGRVSKGSGHGMTDIRGSPEFGAGFQILSSGVLARWHEGLSRSVVMSCIRSSHR